MANFITPSLHRTSVVARDTTVCIYEELDTVCIYE